MVIGKRLEKIRNKLSLTQEEFAEKIGVKKPTISKIETGMQDLPSNNIMVSLMETYKISLDWLLTGQGNMFLDEPSGGGEKIPVNGEIECSAGIGCFPGCEEITEYYTIDPALLKSIGANKTTSRIVKVRGNSMEPTLSHGSNILIDLSKTDIYDGKIYVLRIGDIIKLKRLQKLTDRIKVISDNKDYEPETLYFGKDDFQVIAQALWVNFIL